MAVPLSRTQSSLCCIAQLHAVGIPCCHSLLLLKRHVVVCTTPVPQDLKNALSPAECCEALGLPQMKGRKWHVQVMRRSRAVRARPRRGAMHASGAVRSWRAVK